MMAVLRRKALVVGISGASSSGKTTLSRLLRDIFPNTFVLHEDDFYKPEKDIPWKHGVMDWDCADALVIPDIARTLDYIRQNGNIPTNFDSKEDRNSVGDCPVSDDLIASLKTEVSQWVQPGCPGHRILISPTPLRLCIFDGFLLYSDSMLSIQQHIDLKFFLRVSYEKAKSRREARDGYATIEGFWQDPPGYVDKIVWPNYSENHKWMFEKNDVSGKLKEDVLREWKINSQVDKALDVDLETTLVWAVGKLIAELENLPNTLND